jgi:hypothetical protein
VNRVVLVVLLLIAMLLCSVLVIVPAPVFAGLSGLFGGLARYFGRFEVYSAGWAVQLALGVFVAVAVSFVLILLIILEVRRPSTRPIRVEKAAGGDVLIDASSVADRLRYEIGQLPGVVRVRPKVRAKRRSVAIELDVETAPGLDVPEKAERIVTATRLIVEEKLGLKLARRPRVRLRSVQYPRATTTRVAMGQTAASSSIADLRAPEVEGGTTEGDGS